MLPRPLADEYEDEFEDEDEDDDDSLESTVYPQLLLTVVAPAAGLYKCRSKYEGPRRFSFVLACSLRDSPDYKRLPEIIAATSSGCADGYGR